MDNVDPNVREWWNDPVQRARFEERMDAGGMSRRRVLGIIGAFAAGTALVACGGSDDEEPSSGSQAPAGGTQAAGQAARFNCRPRYAPAPDTVKMSYLTDARQFSDQHSVCHQFPNPFDAATTVCFGRPSPVIAASNTMLYMLTTLKRPWWTGSTMKPEPRRAHTQTQRLLRGSPAITCSWPATAPQARQIARQNPPDRPCWADRVVPGSFQIWRTGWVRCYSMVKMDKLSCKIRLDKPGATTSESVPILPILPDLQRGGKMRAAGRPSFCTKRWVFSDRVEK